MKNVSIAMTRESLEGIPQSALPPPYTIRWYRPGDEKAWLRIHVGADKFNEFDDGMFEHQFGTDERVLAERQCYLCDVLCRPSHAR